MKQDSSHSKHISGVTKDVFIILFVFTPLCILDVRVAASAGVFSTAILLFRRIILVHTSGPSNDQPIHQTGKELTVCTCAEVFDLSNVPSMEYLYKYIEVTRRTLVPPAIIIIRFNGIKQIRKYELDTLKEVLRRLRKNKITVILSDVNENVRSPFWQSEIENEVDPKNIFYTISDALLKAESLKGEKRD